MGPLWTLVSGCVEEPGVSQASEKGLVGGWGGAEGFTGILTKLLREVRESVSVSVCVPLSSERRRKKEAIRILAEAESRRQRQRTREKERSSPAEGGDPPLPDPREVGRRQGGVQQGSRNSSLKMNPRSRARGGRSAGLPQLPSRRSTEARAGSSRPRPTSRVLKASLSHFPRRLLQQLSSE